MRFSKHEVLTPANAITLLGLILTVVGCFNLDELSGLILVVVGRLLDLVDGPVARATKTTQFSTLFDPTADKIALASMIIAVLYYHLAPELVIVYILLQNGAVALMSIKAERQKKAVGALIPGKLNLFFQIIAIVLFITARLLDNEWSVVFDVLGYASFIISVPLSLIAMRSYARLLREPPTQAAKILQRK